jgi:hypothetical protein
MSVRLRSFVLGYWRYWVGSSLGTDYIGSDERRRFFAFAHTCIHAVGLGNVL